MKPFFFLSFLSFFFLKEKGVGKKINLFCSYFLQEREDTEAWAVCVLWVLPWDLLPPVRALGGSLQVLSLSLLLPSLPGG